VGRPPTAFPRQPPGRCRGWNLRSAGARSAKRPGAPRAASRLSMHGAGSSARPARSAGGSWSTASPGAAASSASSCRTNPIVRALAAVPLEYDQRPDRGGPTRRRAASRGQTILKGNSQPSQPSLSLEWSPRTRRPGNREEHSDARQSESRQDRDQCPSDSGRGCCACSRLGAARPARPSCRVMAASGGGGGSPLAE
jgi:hypothetical protein